MAKTAYEQLLDLLGDDPDTRAKVQAKLAANPKLIAEDAFTTELFGIYKGVGDGTTTETVVPPAAAVAAPAVHVPTVPNTVTTTAAPITTTTSTDSAAILAALNSLKTSVDDRMKNLVTMDKVTELGAGLVNQAAVQALRQADEIYTIRDTHRQEFGETFDRAAFEKFVTDASDPTTKRNKYPTLTDAYNAMVAEKRIAAKIAKGVEEGTKQKLSGLIVPGQTTTVSLSPAQQVLKKAAARDGDGAGSAKERAMNQLAALERAREAAGGSATVQ